MEDEILQSTKSVIQDLVVLKNEHEKMISSSNNIEENLSLLRKSMNMILMGINEAQIMIQLDYHLQNLEAEKYKLRAQVKRLCQENAWLRDELGSTQKKVHQCEQINASYSVEIEHLKFLQDIKQPTNQLLINEQDLENELFPLPIQSEHNVFISSNDYEIPTRLKTLHNLVIQYASQGRYEIAIPLCRQALEDLEKTLGHQHPDIATMLNILALVYRDQSKFKEAIVLLNDALSIREKKFGFDHPAVASTLNNLAILYGKRNKFQEAETLCKRALEIREKCLGSLHPDVAKQLNNLALLCQNMEKYDAVEIYYKRAIDIYTQSLGSDDLNVSKTKTNLASIYLKQQKYKEAEQLYKEILTDITIQNSSDTSTIITTLKNLILLYRQQDRYEVADTLENCILHARNDTQAIIKALDIVQQTNDIFYFSL